MRRLSRRSPRSGRSRTTLAQAGSLHSKRTSIVRRLSRRPVRRSAQREGGSALSGRSRGGAISAKRVSVAYRRIWALSQRQL